MTNHFYAIQVLFREAQQLGQQGCLVIIFNVVDPFEGFQVFGGGVLDLLEELLIIEVEFPNLSIVIIAFIKDHFRVDQFCNRVLSGTEIADLGLCRFLADLLHNIVW
jgi:hypothetical protein